MLDPKGGFRSCVSSSTTLASNPKSDICSERVSLQKLAMILIVSLLKGLISFLGTEKKCNRPCYFCVSQALNNATKGFRVTSSSRVLSP